MQEQMLDSIGLREAAEYAASLRGRGGNPRKIIAQYDPELGDYRLTDAPMGAPVAPEDSTVLAVDTAEVQPSRWRVRDITIKASGHLLGDPVEISIGLDRYDAVFWSEAAVEKFLFPYYASKYQWAAAEVLVLLSLVFYGEVPGLQSGKPLLSAVALADFAGLADEEPFAIAHLPRSDYVPLSRSGPGPEGPNANFLLNDVWVLSRKKAKDEMSERPLAHYANLLRRR